jgi:hypothetical protein
MPVTTKVYSKPIVNDKKLKDGLFTLNAYDLAILWTIVKNKPMSFYELKKQNFYFPKSRGMATIPRGSLEEYVSKIDEPQTFLYPFIPRVVKRLRNKGLVSTIKDTSGPRTKRIVSPTFKGIIYFLQNENPFEKETWKQIKKSLSNHPQAFLNHLELLGPIGKIVEPNAFFNALMETVWEFYGLRKVRVSIKQLDMVFEGYIEDPIRIFVKRMQYFDSNCQKNLELFDYLSKIEAIEGRNAYIGYLAMNDIEFLSVTENFDPKNYANILFSEIELAQFENREPGNGDFLFDGERPLEFFPKYSSLESCFLGMLVRNLLWGSISQEEQRESYNTETRRNFQVEEI